MDTSYTTFVTTYKGATLEARTYTDGKYEVFVRMGDGRPLGCFCTVPQGKAAITRRLKSDKS